MVSKGVFNIRGMGLNMITLCLFKIAMENGPFIDGLPI